MLENCAFWQDSKLFHYYRNRSWSGGRRFVSRIYADKRARSTKFITKLSTFREVSETYFGRTSAVFVYNVEDNTLSSCAITNPKRRHSVNSRIVDFSWPAPPDVANDAGPGIVISILMPDKLASSSSPHVTGAESWAGVVTDLMASGWQSDMEWRDSKYW